MSASCWTVVGASGQVPLGTSGAGGTNGAEASDQVVPSGDLQRSRPMPAGELSVQPSLRPPTGRPVQAGEVSAPDAPLLLRVGEAARLLGVSRSTMYQLVGSGQVPVVRIG
jgi:hypothetical protein